MVVFVNRIQSNSQKQVYFSRSASARFCANWPSQSLQKGPKLKILSRLQFHSTVFVNDFTPQKWLYLSIEFNQTVKNKYTSLVVRAPVFVLIGPISDSKRDQNWKFRRYFYFYDTSIGSFWHKYKQLLTQIFINLLIY